MRFMVWATLTSYVLSAVDHTIYHIKKVDIGYNKTIELDLTVP